MSFLTTPTATPLCICMQVYLPMGYCYALRLTAKPTKIIHELREVRRGGEGDGEGSEGGGVRGGRELRECDDEERGGGHYMLIVALDRLMDFTSSRWTISRI